MNGPIINTVRSAKSISNIGAFLAAFSAMILAVTNVIAPLIYGAGGNPSTVLMLRAIVTVITIAAILGFQKRLRTLPFRDEVSCFISGLLFMFAGIGLLTAYSLIPVSIAVLVLYLYPLLTTLFDSIARRQLPRLPTVLLMILALFGLGLALEAGDQALNIYGLLLALLAAVSVAATFVWNNHKLAHVNPELITLRMFCINLVIFTVYVWYSDSFALPQSSGILVLQAVMLICFAVAFITMFRGAQMAGSVRAAMIMNLEPVASIILSVIILSESVNLLQGVGAALVLAAVLISQTIGRRWQRIENSA